jgi:hypothetical protein
MPKSDLVGVWQLESLELRSADGQKTFPMGPDAKGYISYNEDGFMSVAIMQQGRKPFNSNDIRGGTMEEQAEAAAGYLSYCGTYEVKQRQVVHHIEVSLFPNWISVDQIRSYEIEGDRLTLSTQPFLVAGKEQTAHLLWRPRHQK